MNRTIFFALLWFIFSDMYGQQITVSGYIKDAATGEALIGASVFTADKTSGAFTNTYGYYSLTIRSGSVPLNVSYVGYSKVEWNGYFLRDTVMDFALIPRELQEVVVYGEQEHETVLSPHSVNKIGVEQLTAVPMLFGESDIVRALALTPGVSIGIEGTTGLLVRGGTPDQNLILLDEAPVYNASHFFGFISVFNTDAIKEVNLIKGGFPARYGGRLSSVMDISLKEGNYKKWTGSGSIGILSSKVRVEGPLKPESTSLFFTGRASYLSLLFLPGRISYAIGKSDQGFSYWMDDVTLKVNHLFPNKSSLHLSAYQGGDFWKVLDKSGEDKSEFGLRWGNRTATLRYVYPFSGKFFLRTMAIASNYRFINSTEQTIEDSPPVYHFWESRSTVNDLGLKADLEYYHSNQHTLRVGWDWIAHRYRPGSLTTNIDLDLSGRDLQQDFVKATEAALYLEDQWKIRNVVNTNLGLRASQFSVDGETYHSLEPRLSANFHIYRGFRLKGSYSFMRQYIHLLTNNGAGLPNDIWVPATDQVPPQAGSQVTLGITMSFLDGRIDFVAEAFQKRMRNLIDYKRGASVVFSVERGWEELIEKGGKGNVSGIEFFLHKKTGKFNGWVSYTLSKNIRKFENINSGNWYPARYDRRHDFSVTGNLELNTTWDVSATWVYATGHALTLPVAVHESLEGFPIYVYEGRNNRRMPDYHRLDIGFNKTTISPRTGRERTFSIGVYNAYNRVNPFYLDFENTYSDHQVVNRSLTKVSLFQFLPYLSYTWNF